MADTTQSAVQEFPAMSWMLGISDLAAIISDPKYTGMPAAQAQADIQARVEGTNWWKTSAPTMRTYEQQSALDPAAFQQAAAQKSADVWDAYLKAGLTPDPTETSALAQQALIQGWTAAQLNDAIVSHVATHPDLLGQVGNIQTQTEQLKESAQKNGLTLDDNTAKQWSIGISAGEHNLADYQAQLVQQAKNKYSYSPGITNALNAGLTVNDYFQPYASEASKLLETTINPDDFFDSPQWSKVTDYTDPTTNARREMTIPEMQTYVKSMDQWKSTKNAQQAASTMAEGIVGMFGKVASSSTPNFGAGN